MGEPLPVGTPVHHSGQIWARAQQRSTATVAAVLGPWPDGAYEYLVYHRGPFSGGVGAPAPASWWASYRTVPILIEEKADA